jgi:hypothetical protein
MRSELFWKKLDWRRIVSIFDVGLRLAVIHHFEEEDYDKGSAFATKVVVVLLFVFISNFQVIPKEKFHFL